MNVNPYQSLQSSGEPRAVGVLSGSRQDLRSVAVYQKGIQYCILGQLLTVVPMLLLQNNPIGFLFLLMYVGVAIVGVVFIFLLSSKVFGVAAGVILGFLTFIPCVGLIVLLIINQRATSILQLNGIRVGLMGAKMEDFESK